MLNLPFDKISRYLPTDLRYYIKGSGYLLTNQVLVVGLGVISTYVFGNWVSPETYGAYGYIRSILGIMTLFTLPGINNAIVRSVARGYEGSLVSGTKSRVTFSLVGVIVLFGITSIFFMQGKPELGYGLAVSAVLFPFAYATNGYLAYLQGKKRFGQYTIYNIAITSVTTLATIGAILYSKQFIYILLTNLAVTAIANSFCLVLVLRQIQNSDVDKDFVSFGRNLSLLSVFGSVSSYADRVIVGTVTDMQSMAYYNLSRVITDLIRSLGVVLNSLTFPKMVTIEQKRLAIKLEQRLILLVGGLVGMGIVLIGLFPPAISFLFPQYIQAIPFMQLMTISASLTVLNIVLAMFFLSQEKLHKIFYTQRILFPLAELLLMLVLVRNFQVYGVIFSRMTTRFISVVILTFLLVCIAHPKITPGADENYAPRD